ncbi:hypothetical protein JHK82_027152 [Glycine max]|nr:hypothetical protein JHK82_027152 [Glycine max]KAG5150920.1 hypothetical protein JHK84_027392 [Glycine max]
MASSNRHWPSMFKSKPCSPHHQWQHDINASLISTSCHRSPYSSGGGGCEERSPEPKPRWNPKPEQIRILEAIFNSGMVNPPRDEIRKIRAQLQEYGQVGDANVFYWFQNRKSRSKHKLRHLQNSSSKNMNHHHHMNVDQQNHTIPTNSSLPQTTTTAPSSSSSSSSEKSSPKELIIPTTKVFSIGFSDAVPNSPTASVNQTRINDIMLPPPPPVEAFFFPVQQQHDVHHGVTSSSQGFCFSELSNVVHAQQNNVGPCTSLLLSEIVGHGAASAGASKKDKSQMKIMHQPSLLNFCVTTPTTATTSTPTTTTTVVVPPITTTSTTVSSPLMPQLQGIGDPGGAARSTVFINDVAFEVAVGPFNVREAFGDDVVLIHASSGQPVLTNQWGLTLHSLQHGAYIGSGKLKNDDDDDECEGFVDTANYEND